MLRRPGFSPKAVLPKQAYSTTLRSRTERSRSSHVRDHDLRSDGGSAGRSTDVVGRLRHWVTSAYSPFTELSRSVIVAFGSVFTAEASTTPFAPATKRYASTPPFERFEGSAS